MYGLTSQQALDSRKQHGSNSLTSIKGKNFFGKYLERLKDPIIKILLATLAVSVLFAVLGETDWIETIGIFSAVAISTVISTFSEGKADQVFKELGKQSSKITVSVYRNNSLTMLPIDEIVVGDCVKVQWGDKIPADGVLVDGEVSVDASDLTGESEERRIIVGDKVLRSSIVRQGEGIFQVEAVGDNSVYGKLAKEVQIEGTEGPLHVKLKQLAKQISIFAYWGAGIIAASCLIKSIMITGLALYFSRRHLLIMDITKAVTLAMVIIVMAVPEGLPLMIAIVSSLNMRKMLRDNVLVRTMSALETAGSLNILFSDKTGTITKGRLKVVAFIDGDGVEFADFNVIPIALRSKFCYACLFNSSAELSKSADSKEPIGGNATERALLMFLPEDATNFDELKRIRQVPFDSAKKYSFCEITNSQSGARLTLIKGAPEIILKRCRNYYDSSGSPKPLTFIEHLENKLLENAEKSVRLVAFAECQNVSTDSNLPDGDFVLVGIVAIKDELRNESPAAITEIKNAGVQVVMITGDRRETAMAIANEAGLLAKDTELILTSEQLEQMSDDEIKRNLPQLRVVARALPSDKSRLVMLCQQLGLVVGMTGDGVNDTPALKRADVAFAMGSGTEAAKEASGMIIVDDNFLSIKKAVLYGRTIYNNIKRFIAFQLTINIAAVTVSFISPFIGIELPLTVTQILWINLLSDSLMAIAFGSEPANEKYMLEPPKSKTQNLVTRDMMWHLITMGSYISIVSLVYFTVPFFKYITRAEEHQVLFYTAYFSFFVFAIAINAFNTRTDSANIFKGMNKNPLFIPIVAAILIIQIIISQFGGAVMTTAALTVNEWLAVVALALTVVPVDILRKTSRSS